MKCRLNEGLIVRIGKWIVFGRTGWLMRERAAVGVAGADGMVGLREGQERCLNRDWPSGFGMLGVEGRRFGRRKRCCSCCLVQGRILCDLDLSRAVGFECSAVMGSADDIVPALLSHQVR